MAPPMAFDSTLKSEELLIMNAPLIVFPVQEFSSGSPMAKNRGAVALCTSMLPLILLLQMYGVKPAEYVPVIEIPPLICAVQMSASEKAPAGVVQTALASMSMPPLIVEVAPAIGAPLVVALRSSSPHGKSTMPPLTVPFVN